jgi:hypothetical protein
MNEITLEELIKKREKDLGYEPRNGLYNNSRNYYENEKRESKNKNKSDLEPPYTEEEIKTYEEKYNIKLPQDFRNYLVNISRETIGSYPYIVTLDKPSCEYIYNNGFNASRSFYYHAECMFDEDKELSKEELEKLNASAIYYIQTHSNGCSDDTYIIVGETCYGRECCYMNGGDSFIIM